MRSRVARGSCLLGRVEDVAVVVDEARREQRERERDDREADADRKDGLRAERRRRVEMRPRACDPARVYRAVAARAAAAARQRRERRANTRGEASAANDESDDENTREGERERDSSTVTLTRSERASRISDSAAAIAVAFPTAMPFDTADLPLNSAPIATAEVIPQAVGTSSLIWGRKEVIERSDDTATIATPNSRGAISLVKTTRERRENTKARDREKEPGISRRQISRRRTAARHDARPVECAAHEKGSGSSSNVPCVA